MARRSVEGPAAALRYDDEPGPNKELISILATNTTWERKTWPNLNHHCLMVRQTVYFGLPCMLGYVRFELDVASARHSRTADVKLDAG